MRMPLTRAGPRRRHATADRRPPASRGTPQRSLAQDGALPGSSRRASRRKVPRARSAFWREFELVVGRRPDREEVDLHDGRQVEDVAAASVEQSVAEHLDVDLGDRRRGPRRRRVDAAERQLQHEVDVVRRARLTLEGAREAASHEIGAAGGSRSASATRRAIPIGSTATSSAPLIRPRRGEPPQSPVTQHFSGRTSARRGERESLRRKHPDAGRESRRAQGRASCA